MIFIVVGVLLIGSQTHGTARTTIALTMIVVGLVMIVVHNLKDSK